MAIWLTVILFVAGMILLVKGADWLVEHSAILAEGMGVPHMVVGLTIVAFGTSAPELAAGVGASVRGVGELALGAVVGSNIANVALILGAASLMAPIACARTIRVKEMPLMLAVMLVGWASMAAGEIGRVEGAVLFAGVVGYTVHTYRASKREPAVFERELEDGEEIEEELAKGRDAYWWVRHAGMVLLGIIALTGGAELLVRSTVEIAGRLGVPEIVIGLTMVAIGTSLPELATSLRAAARGNSEILLGNVIGSNVFNTLCVLGVTALVRPIPVPRSTMWVDGPVMLGFGALAWLAISVRRRIGRTEGAVLLAAYGLYVLYVVLTARPGALQ